MDKSKLKSTSEISMEKKKREKFNVQREKPEVFPKSAGFHSFGSRLSEQFNFYPFTK